MNKYTILLMIIVIIGMGYVLITKITVNNEITQSETPNNSRQNTSSSELASDYFPFSEEKYIELKSQNKPILLYFFANWCPTCAAQEPVIVKFTKNGGFDGKVALRVNYNDSDTDQTEKDLAKQFNITYQHTFVGLDGNGKEVFQVNGQQSEEDLKELFSKL